MRDLKLKLPTIISNAKILQGMATKCLAYHLAVLNMYCRAVRTYLLLTTRVIFEVLGS
jgi:hypothetical protein